MGADLVEELGHVVEPADGVQLLVPLQVLLQGDDVDHVPPGGAAGRGTPDLDTVANFERTVDNQQYTRDKVRQGVLGRKSDGDSGHAGAGDKRHHIDADDIQRQDDGGDIENRTGKTVEEVKNNVIHFVVGAVGDILLQIGQSADQNDFSGCRQHDDQNALEYFFQERQLEQTGKVSAGDNHQAIANRLADGFEDIFVFFKKRIAQEAAAQPLQESFQQ